MKFRILDLAILTTVIAVLCGVFQVDRTFFRQLLYLVFVATSALAMCRLLPQFQNVTAKGAVGGAMGAAFFTAIIFVFLERVYDRRFEIDSIAILSIGDIDFRTEVLLSAIISPVIGAAIGPLLHCHREEKNDDPSSVTKRNWSWILFTAVLLLLFFMMLDRVQLAGLGRNWGWPTAIVSAVFVVHTIGWTNAHYRRRQGEPDPS